MSALRNYLVILYIALFFGYGCASVKPDLRSDEGLKNREKVYTASKKSLRPYKVYGNWYQPLPHADNFIQRGKASWYGKKFHGRKTSSGEIYDMYSISAAHKTLPFGTKVRVHNLDNNKKIDIRINDRGPFARGRIIDLSYAAAKEIGIVGPGTAYVEISAIDCNSQPSGKKKNDFAVDFFTGNFTIQVGAFSDFNNAARLKSKLDQRFRNAHISLVSNGCETMYRVRVGRCSSLAQAEKYENVLMQKGFNDIFTVAE